MKRRLQMMFLTSLAKFGSAALETHEPPSGPLPPALSRPIALVAWPVPSSSTQAMTHPVEQKGIDCDEDKVHSKTSIEQ